ncbi:hypothetical protein LV779_39715 [Streptomyces thinghirensis]|nr:hypothetical protein [Streptomyces thinghirensis]
MDAQVRAPVNAAVSLRLQAERAAAVSHATDPSAVPTRRYRELSAHTDRAVAKLRLSDRHTVADSEELPAGAARRLKLSSPAPNGWEAALPPSSTAARTGRRPTASGDDRSTGGVPGGRCA